MSHSGSQLSGQATEKKLEGVLGFFDDPSSLIEATKRVRDKYCSRFDVFTPYPVHGLEHAQGLKRSRLPYVTFTAGLTGFLCAFALQYWTSVIDWPLNVGGRPLNSWPAFVPVLFELTVLFAGISTFLSIIAFCRLPNLRKKSFDPSLTRDRFAILIEQESASETDGAESFLKQVGAKETRKVFQEGWF